MSTINIQRVTADLSRARTYKDLGLGHPTRLAIIVELLERDVELSASELSDILKANGLADATLGATAYHVRTLANKSVLRVKRRKRVRGAIETFYVIAAPARKRLEKALA